MLKEEFMKNENQEKVVKLLYKNWRNETAIRTVLPKRIYFGSTEWHPTPGWIMVVHDIDRDAEREYFMADIEEWGVNDQE